MLKIEESVERLYKALIWELSDVGNMEEFRTAKVVIACKLLEKAWESVEPTQPGETVNRQDKRLQLGSYEVDGVRKAVFPDEL